MITEKDIRLDFIPEEGEGCYVSDDIDTLVSYVNKKEGTLDNLKNKYPYETIGGTEWKYAYPVNGYKDEKIEDEKTTGEIKPKRGDIVEVSDDEKHWVQRIFLEEIEGMEYPFICVDEVWEKEFKNGEKFRALNWPYIRKPESKTKLTKAEIAEKLNIPVEELEIVD